MAVNQQLKDYIDQQVKVGVPNNVIKAALLETGWRETDINEAMALFVPSAGAAPAKPAEMIKPVEIKPIEIKPIDSTQPSPAATAGTAGSPQIKSSYFSPVLPKVSPGSGAQEKPAPVSFVTSDIFQPKNESAFETKGIASQTPFPVNKPQIISAAGGMGAGPGNNFFKKQIVPIVLGAVSILLFAGAGILYAQNSGLQNKINSISVESSSLKTNLDLLASDKNALTEQVATLNQAVNDLSNQLSIYASPADASKTQELPITIKGVLGGGGKAAYVLTTNKDILVAVKNSGDSRVDGVLKPLLGTQVEISGTHLLRSDSVTVTAINGAPLPPLESATATSTKNGATP
ncbi:MAG: hypothetical protein HY433_00285 [Candidatus Liptonbacteria bacterium]|nr:hypothetical protein [Candidatus Liptonbacteria bacterium]